MPCVSVSSIGFSNHAKYKAIEVYKIRHVILNTTYLVNDRVVHRLVGFLFMFASFNRLFLCILKLSQRVDLTLSIVLQISSHPNPFHTNRKEILVNNCFRNSCVLHRRKPYQHSQYSSKALFCIDRHSDIELPKC